MKVACYAYEGMYQGLHGIKESVVMEVSDNLEEARCQIDEWGYEATDELIYSFGLEQEYFEEVYGREDYSEEDVENFDISDSYSYCDRGWYCHKIIKDNDLSVEKLDNILQNKGYELFVEQYCEKETLF